MQLVLRNLHALSRQAKIMFIAYRANTCMHLILYFMGFSIPHPATFVPCSKESFGSYLSDYQIIMLHKQSLLFLQEIQAVKCPNVKVLKNSQKHNV